MALPGARMGPQSRHSWQGLDPSGFAAARDESKRPTHRDPPPAAEGKEEVKELKGRDQRSSGSQAATPTAHRATISRGSPRLALSGAGNGSHDTSSGCCECRVCWLTAI